MHKSRHAGNLLTEFISNKNFKKNVNLKLKIKIKK